MPGTNVPAHQYFAKTIHDMQQQIAQLNTQQRQGILPSVDAYVTGPIGCTAVGTATVVAGSPAVTAIIGSGGDCIVSIGALPSASVSNQANLFLFVDGSIIGGGNAFVQADAASYLYRSIRFKLYNGSGLTAGPHTFSMRFDNATSSLIDWYFLSMNIQPL